MDKKIYIIYIT